MDPPGSSKGSIRSQRTVVEALRGQTLRVPNLKAIFAGWPPARRNPLYASMAQPWVEKTISRVAETTPSVAGRRGDDIALLTSLWYPNTATAAHRRSSTQTWPEDDGEEQPSVLRALAEFSVWLVCWDDEVDADDGGDLAGDFDAAETWRQRTLQVLEKALDLSSSSSPSPPSGGSESSSSLSDVLQSFAHRLARDSPPAGVPERFLSAVRYFVEGCSAEQRMRLADQVPSWEEYVSVRRATSAAHTILALVGYAASLPVPQSSTTALGELEDAAADLVGLVNDILSLKKELRAGCAINAVAARMKTGQEDLQVVVDELEGGMQRLVGVFDGAAAKLVEDTPEERLHDVKAYIDGCRDIVVGTLEFT